MSDLIYRQAAIDALEKVAELYPWRVPGNRDSYSQYNEAWQDALNRADSEIEALPSAQPERKKPVFKTGESVYHVSYADGTGGFGKNKWLVLGVCYGIPFYQLLERGIPCGKDWSDVTIKYDKTCHTHNEFWGSTNPLRNDFYPNFLLKGFTVKKIIHSGPCTIVIWGDGDKTIVRKSSDDPDDEYAAFCAAFCKRVFGSTSAVKRMIKKKTVAYRPTKKEKKELKEKRDKENAVNLANIINKLAGGSDV